MADGAPEREARLRLQELVAYPREDLAIEIKPWLDLGDLAQASALGQALLALANHGGGFVLMGFAESDGTWLPADERPDTLAAYNQDAVNGVVARYAEPTFHCQVQHVEHPETGLAFPVVVVPGGHRVPIRSKSEDPERRHVKIDTYYIRRPGPCSEPPRTGREWDELIGRCVLARQDELVESLRAVIRSLATSPPDLLLHAGSDAPFDRSPPETVPSTPGFSEGTGRARLSKWTEESRARFETLLDTEHQEGPEKPRDRYRHGVYSVAYSVEGEFEPPSLTEFRALLERVKGHETGWPPWLTATGELAPRPFENTVECWLYETIFADAAHSDYWRAAPTGLMYQIQGYDDDSKQQGTPPPGQVLDFVLPIWRIGPCLLHAERLARALGDPDAEVQFWVRWEGLEGRTLTAWASGGRYFSPHTRPAIQDTAEAAASTRADAISETLPELVQELTRPLYTAFDFFSVPPQTFETELAQLRGRG